MEHLMDHDLWDEPVIGPGHHFRSFGGSRDALAYLLAAKGGDLALAKRACMEAAEGRGDPSTAASAFRVFAGDAGIFAERPQAVAAFSDVGTYGADLAMTLMSFADRCATTVPGWRYLVGGTGFPRAGGTAAVTTSLQKRDCSLQQDKRYHQRNCRE
jgi:hypothetical protein